MVKLTFEAENPGELAGAIRALAEPPLVELRADPLREILSTQPRRAIHDSGAGSAACPGGTESRGTPAGR